MRAARDFIGRLFGQPSQQAQDDFRAGLQAWVESALPEEREGRAEAMLRMIEARRDKSTELLLLDLGLSSLPEQIGDLTDLTSLNLGDNQLTTLPERIGNLTALTSLDLNHNQLTTLPEQIGNLTALTFLNLSNNQLTTLPERIGNLTALTSLDLGSNQLTTIPEQIGNLTALTSLDFDGNQLTTILEQIGNLTALTFLNLSNNQLTTIPEQIENLTALTFLILSNNQLTTIPEQIGNLTALKALYLDGNQLTSLPDSIFTNSARTSEIDISANNNRFLAAEALRLNALTQQNPLVRLGISIYEPHVAARAAADTTPTAIINEIITQSLGEAAVTESEFTMSRSILANTSLDGFHTFLGQCSRTKAWQAEGETKKTLCTALYGIMQKIDQNPDLAETVNLTSIGSDESCGDRVALTLAQLQIATMFDGKKPEEMGLVEIYKYAEANAVVNFLNDKAAERFAPGRTAAAIALAPNGTDEIETYLAFYHVLPMVDIKITGIDMLYRFCANVTEEHLKSAKAELERGSSIESLTHQQYLTFAAIADDKNFQEIPFVKEARSKGKTEEEALHDKLEAALLGGNSGEAEKQAQEILQEQKNLTVKNLAKSYQVSLSAESVTASQTKDIASEEEKYKSDSEEFRPSEERPSSHQASHQGVVGAAAEEGEETAAITEASRERAEDPRVGATARRTFTGQVCDSLSNPFRSSKKKARPDPSMSSTTSDAQPLTNKRNKLPLHVINLV